MGRAQLRAPGRSLVGAARDEPGVRGGGSPHGTGPQAKDESGREQGEQGDGEDRQPRESCPPKPPGPPAWPRPATSPHADQPLLRGPGRRHPV
jgi:hypothetical protein